MAVSVLRDIFRVNLGVKKTERCLVFTDFPASSETPSPDELERRSRLRCLAFLISETGKSFAKGVVLREFAATGSHGAEPPREIWETAFGRRTIDALDKKGLLGPLLSKTASGKQQEEAEGIIGRFCKDAVDVVIALSNYSTSHTRFRDFLTTTCGTRYASMPLFEFSMLEGPMSVDWKELARISKGIAARLNKAVEVSISTPNGSGMAFSVKGRKALADTGMLRGKGAFGNLPAGEVFVAPVEGSAKGRLVLDWAPTRELASPVTLVIREGLVQEVSGEEPFADELRKRLSEREENRNIAEFGIGTNSRAKRPDNILESEKIMGTIHIALGDNSTFGGKVKTPMHQDFVFFRPTVRLTRGDGSADVLMKAGRLEAAG
ncbi:MAG: aminopeptidase [Nitrospiraceae bacterium]|nr:aminopeptidase [Nitrospiraceae bacterium]